MFAPTIAYAFTGEKEIDGIWYNVVTKNATAEVISSKGNKYSGNIVIPATIEYDGVTCNVNAIKESAFSYCDNLIGIKMPSSIKTIGSMAFLFCSKLTSIEIPSNVVEIGYRAFAGCSGMNVIIVENANPTFDSRNNCNAIIETSTNKLIVGCNNTTIPSGVTTIGTFSFEACSGLSSLAPCSLLVWPR